MAAILRRAMDPGTRPPHDLTTLLEIGGFDVSVTRLTARNRGIEAALIPQAGNRFRLVVDTEPPGGWASVRPHLRDELARQRLRFRIAHEIAHSLFYDRSGTQPRRLVSGSPAQERWCDRFASALLVPPYIVASTPPEPKALCRMQQRFDVSLQVVVRAFARVHRDRFAALLCDRGTRAPQVRIQWQKREHSPAARWWAAAELQAAITSGVRSGTVSLPFDSGERTARWRTLPSRGQILIVA
jgi:IrrE N-terminal-like domain